MIMMTLEMKIILIILVVIIVSIIMVMMMFCLWKCRASHKFPYILFLILYFLHGNLWDTLYNETSVPSFDCLMMTVMGTPDTIHDSVPDRIRRKKSAIAECCHTVYWSIVTVCLN